MVTRTVHGTEVAVKVVETATEQIVQETVILNKKYDNDEKLKKAVRNALAPEKILVSIVEAKEVEKCYGIPADKFMELAVEIDPKTRAALKTEEAAETNAE